MYEIYRARANDINRDRMREAAEARLARQVPRTDGSSGPVARLRRLASARLGQPAPTPRAATGFASDSSGCGS
jgi:hypothetical protein